MKVSILVFLDLALRGPGPDRKGDRVPVSILVFLDLALRGERCPGIICRGEFQSLFSWILLSEVGDEFSNDLQKKVSILVFLDLALRERISWDLRTSRIRFNPCFLGSCSPSKRVILPGCCNSVSILVFLDLALRGYDIFNLDEMFREEGFNPCFLGSCSPRVERWR